MIRVYVVEDDSREADAFHTALLREPDIHVAGSGAHVDVLARPFASIDIVLVSIHLQDDGVRRVLDSIDWTSSAPRVVMTGVRCPESDLLPYLDKGIAGYVLADSSPAELAATLRMIQRGEVLLSPKLAATMMHRLVLLSRAYHRTKPVDPEVAAVNTLTSRECDVIELVGRGYSNQEIADYLNIEVGTVKNHVHNILRKLDVTSRRAAASLFSRTRKQTHDGGPLDVPTPIYDAATHRGDIGVSPQPRRRRLPA